MLEKRVERNCREVLQRGVVEKCRRRVLETSVVENCWSSQHRQILSSCLLLLVPFDGRRVVRGKITKPLETDSFVCSRCQLYM